MIEKKIKKFLAFVFSFFIFVPNFSPSICAMGDVNILIVGKPGAGKSTLLYRFIKQNFDKPIDPKEVSTYEHGKIYTCPVDARFKIAEMDFEDESLVPEYKDYLYQNAHIIIHLSNIGKEPPPTKKDVSKWYDEFVRTIFRGLGDPRGHGKDFRANPENVSHRNAWFSPLQLGGKIGYIIFCFNNSENFDARNECEELWQFIGTFSNARSILIFDSVSSNGDGDTISGIRKNLITMDEWIRSLASLAHFESFDEDMINRYMPSPRAYTAEDIHKQLEANENMNPFLKWTLGLAGTFGIGTTAIYTINRINLYRKNKEEQDKARRKQYLNKLVESNLRKTQKEN